MKEIHTFEDLIANLRSERDAARIELCKKDAERAETTWKEEASLRGWGYLHTLDTLTQLDEEIQ